MLKGVRQLKFRDKCSHADKQDLLMEVRFAERTPKIGSVNTAFYGNSFFTRIFTRTFPVTSIALAAGGYCGFALLVASQLTKSLMRLGLYL